MEKKLWVTIEDRWGNKEKVTVTLPDPNSPAKIESIEKKVFQALKASACYYNSSYGSTLVHRTRSWPAELEALASEFGYKIIYDEFGLIESIEDPNGTREEI